MDPLQNTPSISLPPIDQSGGGQDVQQPQPVVATQPLSAPPVSGGQNSNPLEQPASSVSAPTVADDVDLIEKEWVNKVKEIVEKTKNDPYEQSRQLTMLKADYLQKRYNKSIKLT